MRILVISNLSRAPVLSSAEHLCEQICSELLGMGHDVQLVTGERTAEELNSFPVHRSLSLFLPREEQPGQSRLRRWVVQRTNYCTTQGIISRYQPELILLWSQLQLTIGCALAAEESGIPVAYAVNDELTAECVDDEEGWKASLRRWGDDQLLQLGPRKLRLTHVTCGSYALKKRLCERGMPLQGAAVIYPGFSVEKFASKAQPGSIGVPASLLYVGPLQEEGGIYALLEATELLSARGRGVRVTLCGEGNGESSVRLRRMAACGQASIHFVGRLEQDKLPALYRAHDIFVYPITSGGTLGLPHLRAMASGTTVVSTAEGDQGEFLRDGINSLIVRPGSVADLAQKLDCLLERPELMTKLAQAAQLQVIHEFTLKSYARQLVRWLEEIRRHHLPENRKLRPPLPTAQRVTTLI